VSYRLREAGAHDIALLREVLYEAIFWRSGGERSPRAEAMTEPELACYVEGFGRKGDFGLIAEVGREPVGAAWWRHLRAEDGGYGFVGEATPELSIAVLPGHRGDGVGTLLLEELMREGRCQGIAELSLSVERDNPALRLYKRLGYRALETEASSLTMVVDLSA